MTPKQIADNYESEYSFLCINAVMRNAAMVSQLGDDEFVRESKEVYDVLIARGWKIISSEEEYIQGCAIHGIPKFFADKP